ncbi:hypothetical protein NL386_37230, partial [Klebsiella pneumoniae]|nr:hypothetical protein [Klebsiella pneumoniae]
NAFVTGLMFDKDGRPITIEQVQQLQAQGGDILDLLAETPPSATPPQTPENVTSAASVQSPSERMYRDIENSNWIRLGNASAPVIYSFIDPQCPHCH